MVIEEIDDESGQDGLGPGDCISTIGGKSLQELGASGTIDTWDSFRMLWPPIPSNRTLNIQR